MEHPSESMCTNVFLHCTDELTAAFTELWTQLINEKEGNTSKNVVLQTNVSGL